jgi:IS30 family transposase
VDLTFWSNENNGYKFILTVVDVLSKYAWAYPLKSKSADDVTKAFEELFKHVIPEKLWFDEGKEFYNKKLAAVLKKHNIEFYSTPVFPTSNSIGNIASTTEMYGSTGALGPSTGQGKTT